MTMARASAYKMQWTRETIFQELVRVLVDALGVDADEDGVGDLDNMEVRLATDLGAESVDFLDIAFQVKKRFGVLVAGSELFFAGVTQSHAPHFHEYVAKDGTLTEVGVEELLKRTPWMPWDGDIVKKGVLVSNLFTVGYIVHYLEKKLGVVS